MSVAAAGLFLVTGSLFAVIVFVPVLLQVAAGFVPTEAGLLLATMTIGMTAATTVAGRRIARTGRLRRLPVLGPSVMAAALAGLALAAPAASPALVIAGLVVFGAGFGLTSQLLVVAVRERTRIGVATSTTAFFRAFDGATGAAGLGAVFAAAGRPVADAVQTTFFVAAGRRARRACDDRAAGRGRPPHGGVVDGSACGGAHGRMTVTPAAPPSPIAVSAAGTASSPISRVTRSPGRSRPASTSASISG